MDAVLDVWRSDDEDSNEGGGNAEAEEQQEIAKDVAHIRMRDLLLSLLFGRMPRDDGIDQVIALITEFPSLSARYYEYARTFFTPIHFFLMFHASLLQIQRLLSAAGDHRQTLLTMVGPGHDTPLHIACKYSPSETIECLAQEYPDALRERNHVGSLPLHCALRALGDDHRTHPISAAVVKNMVELYPESVSLKNNRQRHPLALAVANGCPLPLIQYMIELFPDDIQELTVFMESGTEGVFMDLELARTLAKLLPQLEEISLDVSEWTLGAFSFFLKRMINNSSIQTVGYLALPLQRLDDDSMEALAALVNTARIRHLQFSISILDRHRQHVEQNVLLRTIHDLAECLPSTRNLEILEFQGFLIQNIGVLTDLLVSPTPVTRVTYLNCRVLGHWVETNAFNTISRNNRIEELTFFNCFLSDDCWTNIIRRLSSLPNLRALSIHGMVDGLDTVESYVFSEFDFTESLVELLSKGKLQRLSVPGFKFDMMAVCECLKRNFTLWYFGTSQKRYPRIGYFCTLNMFNRKKAGNPETTVSEMISILECAMRKRSSCEVPLDETSLLYGLLREAPSVWCNPIVCASAIDTYNGTDGIHTRKRKFPTP